MKLIFACLGILAAFLLTSNPASADLVYEIDYNSASNPNYDQADPTAITTKTYSAGTGADGSTALQVDFDTTTDPFSVSYFSNLGNSSVNAGVSDNEADYVYSFDYRIEGFDAGTTSVFTQAQIVINDNTYQVALSSATASYQTASFKLSEMDHTEGTFTASDLTMGIQQARVGFLGLNGKFGLDTNNTFFIDNIRLTEVAAVPEPSAMFALCSIAGLVFARRKLRSCRK